MDTPFRDCLKSEESVDFGTALELLKTSVASGDELNALALWDKNVRVDSITYEFKNTSSLYLGSGCIYGPQLNSQHLRLLMESSGLQQQWVALQTCSPGLWTTPSGLSQLQVHSRYWSSMLVPFSLLWQRKRKKRKVCLGSQFEGTVYHGGKVMAAGE